MSDGGVKIGDYALSELIRQVRRQADFSQRELAKHAGVSASSISGIETGRETPSLAVLQRILHAANFRLVVVDEDGRTVLPLQTWQDTADGAGRRYPAHLDTIIDPEFGEWWADGYGLARPPETFRRDRAIRDFERSRSRWEVRVAQLRSEPPPRAPVTSPCSPHEDDGDP